MKKQLLIGAVCGAVVIALVLALVTGRKKGGLTAPIAKQEAGSSAAAKAAPAAAASGSLSAAASAALPAADEPVPVVRELKPLPPIKEALSQKPVFAKLDFRTIPVPESEREAALRAYEKLVDAVHKKDVPRIFEQAAQMRAYGLDDLAQEAYVAAADAVPDRDALVKLAEAQAAEESPAAGVLYARALYDAVEKGDGEAVRTLTDKMADVPPARDAWLDGKRYLLQEADKNKDLARMTDLSRELYQQGDTEGAKLGFARCYAQAPGPKERLETVKEFDSFGYDLYSEDEAVAFFDQAVAAGDDETAVRFLEFLKTRGSEKTEPMTIAYLEAAGKRDVPLDLLVRVSVPLVMYNAADTNVAVMNVWKRFADRALEKKRLADLETIAGFYSTVPNEQSAVNVIDLYTRMIALTPPLPFARKMYVLQQVSRYGDKGRRLLAQEAPAVVKAAMQADDPAALEDISRILIETEDPALVKLGIEGYEVVRKKLADGKNNGGLLSLGRILADSKDPAVKKFAAGCIGEGLPRAGAEGGIDVPLTVLIRTAAEAAKLDDPPLMRAVRTAVLSGLQTLRTSPLLLKQYEDASRAADLSDADIRKAGNALLIDVAAKVQKLTDPEETLTVAAGLVRSPDAGVRAAGVNLLHLLWEKQQKEKTYPPELVKRLISVMSGSGDPALKGTAEAAATALEQEEAVKPESKDLKEVEKKN